MVELGYSNFIENRALSECSKHAVDIDALSHWFGKGAMVFINRCHL